MSIPPPGDHRAVTPTTGLWEALALDSADPPVVAIVGGGGKTSLLSQLGAEAAARGRCAVLAGTSRFTPPRALRVPDRAAPETLVVEDGAAAAPAIAARLDSTRPLLVHSGWARKGRLGAISDAAVSQIAALPRLGLLAIEADGSRGRPFKAPADHEPAIPAAATHVVAVVGLLALDRPLDAQHVHRPEQVIAIAGPAERCTRALVARVLADERGGRKRVGTRAFTVLINQAERDPRAAGDLARAITAAGVPRVVVASLRRRHEPVIEVWRS